MPTIRLEVAQLSTRSREIEYLLQPLVRDPQGKRPSGYIQCQKAVAPARRQYVLAAHGGVAPSSDYQTWRFPTFRRGFSCRYFEIWETVDERARYFEMNRAYFNLFQVSLRPPSESSLLALHCDPIVADNEPHAQYKKGPHLHLDFAGDPLSHAHLALNRGHLDYVLESVENLSEALAMAVSMLSEQVLQLSWSDAA